MSRQRKNRTKEERRLLLISGEEVPFSFIEAYKSIRTNLKFSSVSKPYRKIVITSSLPRAGKSNFSINLAITLAADGARVILLDADLRKPTLHRYLQLPQRYASGLTDVLAGQKPLGECIINMEQLGIDILLSGPIPPNPTELLSSDRMKQMMDALGKSYDYVICDTPPVTAMTDAAVLSRIADGVIFIIRQNMANREQIAHALHNLEAVSANIIGAVLNDFDMKKSGTGSYYYKNYDKYYDEYTQK